MQRWLRTLSILPILLLTACAMGPDYIRPQVDVAEKFRMAPMEGESVANLRWWELLQDETLQQLIRQALQENKISSKRWLLLKSLRRVYIPRAWDLFRTSAPMPMRRLSARSAGFFVRALPRHSIITARPR